MQGIYNYITETNHVSRSYNVAAILWLQFMTHVMVFPTLNVVYIYVHQYFPHVTVFPTLNVVYFYVHQYFPQKVCSAKYGCCLYSFTSFFTGMSFRYFLNNSDCCRRATNQNMNA
jgi:hypothetical protein